MSQRRKTFWVCAILAAAVFAVYFQTLNFDFVNYDDNFYVYENPHVQAGLSLENLRYAFGYLDFSYWQPLGLLSLMADVSLFGPNPGWLHVSNMLWHALNAIVAFLALLALTGSLWPSAFVAAAFALHPVNVDSVAWISERKNLLSTFFFFLSLLFYAKYVKKRSLRRYAPVFICAGLGMIAKPMVVTLPFVLLLLDFWPLGRLGREGALWDARLLGGAILEKLPIFVLSAAAVFIGVISNRAFGVGVSGAWPLDLRIRNALVSYVQYLAKAFWPTGLTVFHPFPFAVPLWKAAGASALLLAVSLLALLQVRRRPYLVVGWLWFCGTLIPTAGVVQAGFWPGMAERFAYIPYVGLFICLAWAATDLSPRLRPPGRGALTAMVLCVLAAEGLAAHVQATYWKNSKTLFRHALKVDPGNYVAHNNLGVLGMKGTTTQKNRALQHFEAALANGPAWDMAEVYCNMGWVLTDLKQYDQAMECYDKALEIAPHFAEALYNKGVLLQDCGQNKQAAANFAKALEIKPGFFAARVNLGVSLHLAGNCDEAVAILRQVLLADPASAAARFHLARCLEEKGRKKEAAACLELLLQSHPRHAMAHAALGSLYARMGKPGKAEKHYQTALEIIPGYAEAHCGLANLFVRNNKIAEAETQYRQALRYKPDFATAHANLAALLMATNRGAQALEHLEAAAALEPQRDDIRFNLARQLIRRERFSEAARHLEAVLAHQPNNARAQACLGVALARMGQVDAAIRHLETALRLSPDYAMARANLKTIRQALEGRAAKKP